MQKTLKSLLVLAISLALAQPVLADSPQFYVKNTTIADPSSVLEIPREEVTKIEFIAGNLDADRQIVIKFKINNIDQDELKDAKPIPDEWVRYVPGDTVSIGPQAEEKVTLVITPPDNAEAGTYKFIVSSMMTEYDGIISNDDTIGAVMSPAIGNKIAIKIGEGSADVGSNEETADNDSYYYYIIGFLLFVIIVTIFRSRLSKKN